MKRLGLVGGVIPEAAPMRAAPIRAAPAHAVKTGAVALDGG